MVDEQIKARGITDKALLSAMRAVPREEFVSEDMKPFAYTDSPLPIEEGQTISQPYIVALMHEALRIQPTDRVLEVGCGSGYASAVMSLMAKEVYAIEYQPVLAEVAAARMKRLGYGNVTVKQGDGGLGWPEHAPFQAITIAAGGRKVPTALMQQLDDGGRLIMPVGDRDSILGQRLELVTKHGTHDKWSVTREDLGAVAFVPFIGHS
eukprot:ANDGO_04518.mRNA.1 Protein-L-isoaspartate O-methyltransferase 3